VSTIPAAALSVVEVASTSPTSPELNQVILRDGKAIASDGFVLAEWLTGSPEVHVTLSAELASKAAKAAKREKAETIEVTDDGVAIPKAGLALRDMDVPRPFPATDGLWEPFNAPVATTRLATDRLVTLLKALGVTKASPVVRLDFYESGAVVFTPEPATGARGLIRSCLEEPK
jgi:hypothetical protein